MLADIQIPVIDRAAIERLFGLRRRQAIDLMNRLGGYQAGRTFLIGREQLLCRLDSITAGDEYRWEVARRERLASSIDGIQRTRQNEAVRIPVSPEVFASRLHSLEPDVRLRPGRLVIDFSGPEDILRKLFGLAQALANDYASFEAAVSSGKESILT
jgi:hypothetical protein